MLHILTSALDGCEWPSSCSGCFTHWAGGWMGPKAGLATMVAKRKIMDQPTASYFTD